MKEVPAGTLATNSNSSNTGSACSVALSFHLAGAKRCTPEECEEEITGQPAPAAPAGVTRAFFKILSLVELDTFTLTHGPFTPLDTPGKCNGL